MRISDWSSDVCSSDLVEEGVCGLVFVNRPQFREIAVLQRKEQVLLDPQTSRQPVDPGPSFLPHGDEIHERAQWACNKGGELAHLDPADPCQEAIILDGEGMKTEGAEVRSCEGEALASRRNTRRRSEEHTSELQSLMRISYAV